MRQEHWRRPANNHTIHLTCSSSLLTSSSSCCLVRAPLASFRPWRNNGAGGGGYADGDCVQHPA